MKYYTMFYNSFHTKFFIFILHYKDKKTHSTQHAVYCCLALSTEHSLIFLRLAFPICQCP